MSSEALHPAELALEHYGADLAQLAAQMLLDAGTSAWAGDIDAGHGEVVHAVLLVGPEAQAWLDQEEN